MIDAPPAILLTMKVVMRALLAKTIHGLKQEGHHVVRSTGQLVVGSSSADESSRVFQNFSRIRIPPTQVRGARRAPSPTGFFIAHWRQIGETLVRREKLLAARVGP